MENDFYHFVHKGKLIKEFNTADKCVLFACSNAHEVPYGDMITNTTTNYIHFIKVDNKEYDVTKYGN